MSDLYTRIWGSTIHLYAGFCVCTHKTNDLEKCVPSGEIVQRILSETTKLTCFHKPCRSCRWKCQKLHLSTCWLQEFRFKDSKLLKIQSKSVVLQFIFGKKHSICSLLHCTNKSTNNKVIVVNLYLVKEKSKHPNEMS